MSELIDSFYTIQKRYDYSLDDLTKLVTSTVNTDSPKPLQVLRESISQYRYPTINQANQKIQSCVKDLDIPKSCKVDWDKTLENKGVTITLHCNSYKDFEVFDIMKTNSTKLNNILQEMNFEIC